MRELQRTEQEECIKFEQGNEHLKLLVHILELEVGTWQTRDAFSSANVVSFSPTAAFHEREIK